MIFFFFSLFLFRRRARHKYCLRARETRRVWFSSRAYTTRTYLNTTPFLTAKRVYVMPFGLQFRRVVYATRPRARLTRPKACEETGEMLTYGNRRRRRRRRHILAIKTV